MRITEFLPNLFIKFAPISDEASSSLKVHLSDYYNKYLNSMNEKTLLNEDLAKKAEVIKENIEKLPIGSEEREKEIFRFTELQDQFEKPSIIERVVSFLDKPLVRVALLVSFAFVARYLTKKLTSPVEPKEEEIEETEQPNYGNFKSPQGYGYPPQSHFYPPFYGNGYPPTPQYQQGKH